MHLQQWRIQKFATGGGGGRGAEGAEGARRRRRRGGWGGVNFEFGALKCRILVQSGALL